MISAPQAYIDLLKDAEQLVFVDCYEITTQDGTVYRLSGAEVPVTVPINGVPTTFGLGVIIERSGISTRIGTSVDSMTLTLHPSPDYMLGSVTVLQAVVAGRLDGAKFTLYRAAAASWTSGWVGAIVRYRGTLAETIGTRQSVQITVQSDLQLLNVQQPVRKFQPGCTWTLYDNSCQAIRQHTNGAITSVTQRWQFDTNLSASTISASAGGSIDLGTVLTGGQLKFTSGANSGFTYPVRSFSGSTIMLLRPAGLVLAVGDTFEVTWGCNKTVDLCSAAFGNRQNFGGFPFIPSAETAVPL
jgi:uncharacterized phage protein (TIGR02218 family)